ncbi:MAG TPA: hypothetical protein VHU79_09765 [Sphingomicrobium sp.]|nr:hypothetical protein [Sphingomicrobium sp.]
MADWNASLARQPGTNALELALSGLKLSRSFGSSSRNLARQKGELMVVMLPVAALLLAQAPGGGPAAAPNSSTTPTTASTSASSTATPSAPGAKPAAAAVPECPRQRSDSQTIVICTERPQGYRLDPDVMEAKREKRSPGPPVRPGGRVIPDCTNVGPQPCMTAGINLIGAALTAAQMAQRLAKGQEVGSMFQTDPHPSEYQLYQMAKARREAKEAQKTADETRKAAEAKAKAAQKASEAEPPKPSGQ